ncbi:MAG: FtsX-like permease family protein [Planctomycetes bacterium]|nr:FtsX-like permease family protein [Planctomycetota bacterium]
MKGPSLLRTVRLGVSSLLLHKLRSLLTMLGVLFGVFAVIAMLAIGEGGRVEAIERIRGLGTQNVLARSVKPREDFATGQQAVRVINYGLTEEDLARIEQTFPCVQRVVPVREIYEEVRCGERAMNPRVVATLPNYLDVTGRKIAEGRFLADEDERRVANVCVLDYDVARHLFPFASPLGKEVKIGGDYYTVVGTVLTRLRQKDDPAPAGQGTAEVFIPLETGRKWYGSMQVKLRAGSREMEEVELHELIVEVAELDNVMFVADAVREMLERNHPQTDFEVRVPLEMMREVEAQGRLWSFVLGAIAVISLVVGGIGITNVMLATVTERTREIGIRRALGAKRKHIVTQFLVETVTLCIGGGLVGVAAGLLSPWILELVLEKRAIVTPGSSFLAFGISVVIGIFAGMYPAWSAARMDPVEALRHE